MNINKYLSITLILVLGLTSFSCSNKKNTEGETLNASLRLGWIVSASFSGEVAGMIKFASDRGLDLDIQAGGPGLNAIQLVQTGTNTFGTIAADEVLAANDKGADFVIIGVINYISPGGFVALEESNITSPQDFEGHRVGMLPFGSTTMLYESMLNKNGVDRSQITEITVSPDLRTFLNGNYDVHPVFVYDETVTLEARGVEYNLIEPREYGVTLKGPVYFCKRETLEKQPQLVESFIHTMADGWNYALANPDSAINMLKEFSPDIDAEREAKVLEKGAPYFQLYQGQPINSDYESWERDIGELVDLEIINSEISLDSVLKLQFIQSYYSE